MSDNPKSPAPVSVGNSRLPQAEPPASGSAGAGAPALDLYRQVASRAIGIPEAEVTGEQREAAKTLAFPYLYGMSGGTLRDLIGRRFEFARKSEGVIPVREVASATLITAEGEIIPLDDSTWKCRDDQTDADWQIPNTEYLRLRGGD